MTNARQLYSLQELDLDLDRIREEMARAEKDLGSGLAVAHLEAMLREETERLEQLQSQQRLQQLETGSQRERASHLEQQLYDGSVTNPRDLESLEQETSRVREALQQQDAELLELSVEAEGAETRRAALEKELADTRTAWNTRQGELKKETKRLLAEQEDLTGRRERLAAALDPSTVQWYEHLRMAKGGQAVAKVARGLCQACRMALPTQQLQHVRSGRRTVLCNSCGRTLFHG